MKTQMFPELLDRTNVTEILRINADSVEEGGFERPLEPEEIQQAKDAYAEHSLDYFKLKNELAGIAAAYKNQMKPHEEKMYEQLDLIKNRAVTDEGELFVFIDQEEGMVGSYDSRGYLVKSRRIRPEERQKTLQSNIRELRTGKDASTGTDG